VHVIQLHCTVDLGWSSCSLWFLIICSISNEANRWIWDLGTDEKRAQLNVSSTGRIQEAKRFLAQYTPPVQLRRSHSLSNQQVNKCRAIWKCKYMSCMHGCVITYLRCLKCYHKLTMADGKWISWDKSILPGTLSNRLAKSRGYLTHFIFLLMNTHETIPRKLHIQTRFKKSCVCQYQFVMIFNCNHTESFVTESCLWCF
jgi:hypothetical protein